MKEPEQLAFESVEASIGRSLKAAKLKEVRQQLLESLKQKATIEVIV